MYSPIPITIVLSCLHILFGVFSFVIGILSSANALVWLAHAISPIFCGCFFIICGCTGLLLLKHRTQYSILCFAAITSITIIAAVVNLQLLRLGLVNHTTIGRSFQKESKDIYTIIAIIVDVCEILVCSVSLAICLKLNHDAKHNRFKSHRKEGVFFVQIVSDKDIVIVQSTGKQNKKRTNHKKNNKSTNIKKNTNANKSKSIIESKSLSLDGKFIGDPV